MKTLSQISAIAIVLMYGSCASTDISDSSNVEQSEIFQDYHVHFDAEEGDGRARAQFRFGGSTGTTLRLVNGSEVRFNGNKLDGGKVVFKGQVYSLPIKNYPENSSFIFKDTEGKTYKNEIICQPLGFKNSPGEFHRENGIEVIWAGPSLSAGQEVELHVSNGKIKAMASIDTPGAYSIRLKPSDLVNIPEWKVNFQLVRICSSELSESTHLGGEITARYESETMEGELIGALPRDPEAEEEKMNKETQPSS